MTEELFLPTGKQHISFSELSHWIECSYRHKLLFVDKLAKDEYSHHLVFGTAVHAVCENFIKTREINPEIGMKILDEGLKESPKDELMVKKWLIDIVPDIPEFMEQTFPEWEAINAEEFLIEQVFDESVKTEEKFGNFKGFIDTIIRSKTSGKRKKDVIWILDWKTCKWGWTREQKQNNLKKLQLELYKAYWSMKHNVDPKLIRCGFVLLKKQAKPGKHCQLIPVSVGDKKLEIAKKKVKDSLIMINRGFAMKNRESCKWCEFKDTEFCK